MEYNELQDTSNNLKKILVHIDIAMSMVYEGTYEENYAPLEDLLRLLNSLQECSARLEESQVALLYVVQQAKNHSTQDTL